MKILKLSVIIQEQLFALFQFQLQVVASKGDRKSSNMCCTRAVEHFKRNINVLLDSFVSVNHKKNYRRKEKEEEEKVFASFCIVAYLE